MDIKSGSATHKIGQERYKYLDLANMAFARMNIEGFRECEGFISAFESTLEAGSEAKREFLKIKEQIDNEKVEAIRDWENWKQGLNYWAQYDAQPRREIIEIKSLEALKEACFAIGKRYGLFND